MVYSGAFWRALFKPLGVDTPGWLMLLLLLVLRVERRSCLGGSVADVPAIVNVSLCDVLK